MNKKHIKRITSAILAIGFAAGIPALADNGHLTDATVKSYEEQLAELARKQQQALNELSEIRDSKSDTWTEMGKIDELMQNNTAMKNMAEEQLDAINLSIEDKISRITETEGKIAMQEKAFLDRMVANYMEAEIDHVELLLGASNLVDFLTKMERVNAILEYDKKIIESLDANRKSLEETKAKLLQDEAAQTERIAEFENAIRTSQAIYDEKLAMIASLEADEAKWRKDYEYNKQMENEISKQLENYLAELQRKSQSAYVGGTPGWPLQAGVYYYVSSEQGWRNLYGVQDYHLGIDLACAAGTHILAYNAGTVLKSEYHWSYGNYVLIDHGGGIATLYAHMSECTVKAGDTVKAGQLVGYCGLTGNTFGYHLHFEVRENGSVVNPRNYLTFP